MGDIGFIAIGAAKAEPIDEKAWNAFVRWLEDGNNAGMGYMANHQAIRRDPRLLLEGARTVISLAFSFAPPIFRNPSLPMIACYAYGDDYHEVLRRRLRQMVEKWERCHGGSYRICIDSAPIAERYWAVKCGIGTIGENGSVIVPGYGSMVFLAEVITTLPLEKINSILSEDNPFIKSRPDSSVYTEKKTCNNCGSCIKACPGKAISQDGTIDAKRCLSYLTIEHRGVFTEASSIEALATPAGENTLFGCDLCLRSCPLNRNLSASNIEEFRPREEIMRLTAADIAEMSGENFSRIFKNSPLKRSKLHGLKRNLKITDFNS